VLRLATFRATTSDRVTRRNCCAHFKLRELRSVRRLRRSLSQYERKLDQVVVRRDHPRRRLLHHQKQTIEAPRLAAISFAWTSPTVASPMHCLIINTGRLTIHRPTFTTTLRGPWANSRMSTSCG